PASAGRHRVEHTVRCRREKQVEPNSLTHARRALEREHRYARVQGGEEERVSKAAMSEDAIVRDAEPEANRIEVGNNGAGCTEDPESRRLCWSTKRRADRESGDGVRERRRHAQVQRVKASLP